MHLTTVVALAMLSHPSSARTVWVPEEFDPNEKVAIRARHFARDDTTSCGAAFPADFTCPSSTTCLALNDTASVQAVLCCPSGSDCQTILPIDCDQSLQNATLYPDSALHSSPTEKLGSCGSECCPMGYTCSDDECTAPSAPVAAASITATSSTSSSTLASSATSSTAASSTSPSSATSAIQITPAPTTTDAGSVAADGTTTSKAKFSGASFAAGFVPGIFLGALVTALLLLLLFRKGRSSDSYVDEKGSPRDTLTDLYPLSRRPTTHGRSISEPTVDPNAGHRTEFLRGTPPRIPDGLSPGNGYSVEVSAPAGTRPRTPVRTPQIVKALFSRSPFLNQTPSTPPLTQPPLPAHLKRGTLSFKISPVRQLKKQKSMHSLRRQMTDASRGSNRRAMPDHSRSGSTETIQVLMPSNEPYTPDQRPIARTQGQTYQPTSSTSSTWRTSDGSTDPDATEHSAPAQHQYVSSGRYPTEHFTPTRVPQGETDGALGTPYTPSRYNEGGNDAGKGRVTDVLVGTDGGLRVLREPEKRDTTFSAMMERAGLRKSDLMMGSRAR